MKVTTKGQVTIPQELRNQYGLLPGQEVTFTPVENGALIQLKSGTVSRGQRLVSRLKGSGTVKMSTEEIMSLTRGES